MKSMGEARRLGADQRPAADKLNEYSRLTKPNKINTTTFNTILLSSLYDSRLLLPLCQALIVSGLLHTGVDFMPPSCSVAAASSQQQFSRPLLQICLPMIVQCCHGYVLADASYGIPNRNI